MSTDTAATCESLRPGVAAADAGRAQDLVDAGRPADAGGWDPRGGAGAIGRADALEGAGGGGFLARARLPDAYRQIIEQIPPRDRTIAAAAWFDGWSAKELAATYSMQPRGVEQLLRRTRERMLAAAQAAGLMSERISQGLRQHRPAGSAPKARERVSSPALSLSQADAQQV